MKLNEFLTQLSQNPEQVDFSDTMAVIEENYTFTPSSFVNGGTVNEANQNNGSCKIFAFGLLNNLSAEQTLACFGTYFRDDVLKNPEGDDHQNIRNFMSSAWGGIEMSGQPLVFKK
ncbi:MAG: HopJ type III effector protein [Gammaproteobacteria bacterium]|nr:HopJ type III effector protein [Gammaproteobacteria bacterium]